MARLFTCGFEENNLTATMWTATDGNAPSIGSTAPHSGTYRLNTSAVAGNSGMLRNLSAGKTSGEIFVRFMWRTADATPAADTAMFADRNAAASASGCQVFVTSAGAIVLVNPLSTSTDQTADGVISSDTWYRIEIRHKIANAGGGGELELRLYLGTSTTPIDTLATPANEDTLPTDVTTFRFCKSAAAGTEVHSFDDIAINDDSGTFQNSWCGPGKIALLDPDTDDTVAWTDATGTGTGNAGEVDELPGAPDDDTSYVTSSTANQEDRYNLTAMPSEVTSDATITLADVYARIRGESTSGTRQCRVLIWDEDATQTNGPTTSLNDSTAYAIMSTAQHLVLDTSGKTKADLDDFDAGAEPITDAHATRLTALWVNVEWLESTGGGTIPIFYPHYQKLMAS